MGRTGALKPLLEENYLGVLPGLQEPVMWIRILFFCFWDFLVISATINFHNNYIVQYSYTIRQKIVMCH